jgi:hypothetical protein
VRFIVPSFSGGLVVEAPAAEAAAPEGDVTASIESSAGFNAALAQSLPPGPKGNAVEWYVRPTEGGQYGPADTDSFRQWIAEGRVPSSAWVWRTGWADWKSGSEAVETFAAEKTRTSPPPLPGSRAPFVDPPAGAATPSIAAGSNLTPASHIGLAPPARPTVNGQAAAPRPVDSIYAARRRRRRVNQQLTFVLGTVAIILLVVLVMVLVRPKSPQPVTNEPTGPASNSPTSSNL